jgi:hypothetical protein
MSAIESPVKDRNAAIIDTGQEVSAYRNRKMVIADCYEGRTAMLTEPRQQGFHFITDRRGLRSNILILIMASLSLRY